MVLLSSGLLEVIGRRAVVGAGIALFLAHAAFVVRLIGPGPLGRGDALVQDDYAFHLADAVAARETFWRSGRTWGYSSALMAGFPTGTFLSVDNKACELFTALVWFISPEQAFAIFVAILFLLVPLLGYGTMRKLGLSPAACLMGGVFNTLLFCRFVKVPHAYLAWGMYSHAFMLPLAVYTGAVFSQLPEQSGMKPPLLAGLLLAFGWWVHLLYVIAIGPAILGGMVGAWILSPRPDRWRAWRPALLACSAALVLSLPYLLPLWRFRASLKSLASPFFTNTLGYFESQMASPALYFPHAVSLAGLGGIWLLVRKGRLTAAMTYGVPAVVLFLIGTYGSLSSFLMKVEPGRFEDAVYFFLLPPAVYLLCGSDELRPWARWGLLGVLFVLSFPTMRAWKEVARGNHPLISLRGTTAAVGLPSEVLALLQLLSTHTDGSARVMVEDSGVFGAVNHHYGFTHLPALFPHLIGRESIGGPREDCPLLHHFADFANGKAFQRPLGDFKDGELKRHLELYNVGWIVTWSSPAKSDLEARPFLRPIWSNVYTVFEVAIRHSFTEESPAKVTAGPDEIRVTGASSGLTTLKYHWMEGMRSRPPLRLTRVERLGDPIGFIQVENGVTPDFTLSFSPHM